MTMDKLNIKEAIVVEGRDDTAVVNQITDTLIIETHGFGIARSTWELLEKAYREKGLIILTDPDFSGEEIRGFFLKNNIVCLLIQPNRPIASPRAVT